MAIAFAIAFDVGIIATFIWPDLVELPITIAVWAGVAVIWLASTISAAAAFPPPLKKPASADVDPMFVRARAAYLARDWVAAECRLREILVLAPTDGETQLMLATLLRRVGRLSEAGDALAKLSESDSGACWRTAIATEMQRIAAADREPPAADEPATIPMPDVNAGDRQHPSDRSAAA